MSARRPLILLYHRVVDLDSDPQGLAVSPVHFAEQLMVLKEKTRVAPLAESRPGDTVITFDDGYEDNFVHAVPALSEAGLPATFFIASGGIGTKSEMWWDRLEALLLQTQPAVESLDLNSNAFRLWSDLRSESALQRTYWALFWRLRPLPVHVVTAVLDDVAEQIGAAVAPRSSHRMMTDVQLIGLASAGFEVGAHTVSHPFLSAQPSDVQRRETMDCRTALEEIVAAPVGSFSYPFGGPDAVAPETVRHVAAAGYERACLVGTHSPAGVAELELPRSVMGDWDGDEFERRLQAWLRG